MRCDLNCTYYYKTQFGRYFLVRQFKFRNADFLQIANMANRRHPSPELPELSVLYFIILLYIRFSGKDQKIMMMFECIIWINCGVEVYSMAYLSNSQYMYTLRKKNDEITFDFYMPMTIRLKSVPYNSYNNYNTNIHTISIA